MFETFELNVLVWRMREETVCARNLPAGRLGVYCGHEKEAMLRMHNEGWTARELPRNTGLVLEGGGFRGLYTAGVLDVWMEHGITADGVVGVSAGAAFGYNFKSRQIGRVLRYNVNYACDPRYASLGTWLRTGDLYSRDFAYGEVPFVLDPVDSETFSSWPMRFTVVCTDINTGEAVYHDLECGDKPDVEWIRASASIPVLSRPVELDGRELLDGGVADSIPVDWMRAQGYAKIVVVLTQPAGYRKEPNRLMPLLRMRLRKYPHLVEQLARRHEHYNACLDKIAQLERAGEVFVIRPSVDVSVPAICKDTSRLEEIYAQGRADAEACLAELQAFWGSAQR